MDKTNLENRLTDLLNSESREEDSNTPDFILSELMIKCLEAFELANNKREAWYDIELSPANNWFELIMTAIGEASMCWSETPKGTFDSEEAKRIGLRLVAAMKKPKKQ